MRLSASTRIYDRVLLDRTTLRSAVLMEPNAHHVDPALLEPETGSLVVTFDINLLFARKTREYLHSVTRNGRRSMSRSIDLDIVRRAYAKQIMGVFGVIERRVEAAFASIKREDFLGRGPWQIMRWGLGYVWSPPH